MQRVQNSSFVKRCVLAVITAFTLSTICHAAEGIFIYRQSGAHPVANSTVIEYNSFRKWEPLTQFHTPNNGILKITKFQPLIILPYINPQAPGLEIRARSLKFWNQEYAAYRIAHNTYPASRVHLVNQVLQLKKIVAKLKDGNAWFEGEWIEDHKVDQIKTDRKKKKNITGDSKNAIEHNERLKLLIIATETKLQNLVASKNSLQDSIVILRAKLKDLKSQLK